MKFSRILPILLIIVSIFPMAVPAFANSGESWVFEGGGWGHGVGLSQYGSQGMALDGYGYSDIIDHYYSGADVVAKELANGEPWLDNSEAIWVGISQNLTSRTFRAVNGAVDVCFGDVQTCAAPDVSIPMDSTLAVTVSGTDPLACEMQIDAGAPVAVPGCYVNLQWVDQPGTRVITGGMTFARGSVRVRPNKVTAAATSFHVSVSVDLEEYIYGIAETLLGWDVDALRTQAVIARSYGVNRAQSRAQASGALYDYRKDLCWCHLLASTADQNYDGWDDDNEGSSTFGQKWRNAVDDTAGEVVTHPASGNTIISTYYSSSNGGASENYEDVWGGGGIPWLRSVDDPWSADPDINPLANWTIHVTDADMAKFFGWDYVTDALIQEGPPGVIVKFVGKKDGAAKEKTLNGTAVRSLLNSYGYRPDGKTVRVSPYIVSITDPFGFDDIKGTTFETAIAWLADAGITSGCNPPGNTLFCPDQNVTRGQMAVFVARALSLPAAVEDHFTDDTGKFYEGAANRVFEAGIVSGCGPGKFCGDNLLPRDQMAKFLANAFDVPASKNDYFGDDNGNMFEARINAVAQDGITMGCNPPANTKYCPGDWVTRGQMAAFFFRALKS